MSHRIFNEVTRDGILFGLEEKRTFRGPLRLPPAKWPKEKAPAGTGLLQLWSADGTGEVVEDGVHVPHGIASDLGAAVAGRLGLPPEPPYAYELRGEGRIDESAFHIETEWLRGGGFPVRGRRVGCILKVGEESYRIPRSLFNLIEAVEAFQSSDTTDRDVRLRLWQPIQEAVRLATGVNCRADGYLESLQIFHASAFSLDVRMQTGGIQFDPVLFGRNAGSTGSEAEDHVPEESVAGVDSLVDEAAALLTPGMQRTFLRDRFSRPGNCSSSYPVGRNVFIVLDDDLRTALDVVKRYQARGEEEKRSFVRNPRAALEKELGREAGDLEHVHLFVETTQYAENVTGIGVWEPKVIPWITKKPNSWLPEAFGLNVAGKTIRLNLGDIPAVDGAMRSAEAQGAREFMFGGERIPLTSDARAAINDLHGILKEAEDRVAAGEPPDGEEGVDEDGKASGLFVLEIEDNIEDTAHRAHFKPRRPLIPLEPPERLIDGKRLLPHQREGFDWLVRAWTMGRPGVLLADDMGLGKTFQGLAFLAWLNEQRAVQRASRNPILIVAPTSLLKNWRLEHDKHLLNAGLGPPLEIYGGGVRALKTDAKRGRDIDVGDGGLDRDSLATAGWILTTYETLSNYHLSFGSIRFSAVLFDEMQKIKTPNTINTHAAKSLNADFVVGLTGTPVENGLEDLWCIVDRLHPGLLGDLKAFSKIYDAEDRVSLAALRDVVQGAEPTPLMKRRMKADIIIGNGLPEKRIKEIKVTMPPEQAEAYTRVVAEARGDSAKGMLETLHKLRGCSLHPVDPEEVIGMTGDYGSYVRKSARLLATMEILEEIEERGEKALIFLESRSMQSLMADLLQRRFRLPSIPACINGAMQGSKRQGIANVFQSGRRGQFGVLLLSPRAAGVGLTITAANHVIHLNRWWNPAVEDQCNDRAYRIGQEKPVTIYCPMAIHPQFGEASFDRTLNDMLERKRALSRDLLVPPELKGDSEEMFRATVMDVKVNN